MCIELITVLVIQTQLLISLLFIRIFISFRTSDCWFKWHLRPITVVGKATAKLSDRPIYTQQLIPNIPIVIGLLLYFYHDFLCFTTTIHVFDTKSRILEYCLDKNFNNESVHISWFANIRENQALPLVYRKWPY